MTEKSEEKRYGRILSIVVPCYNEQEILPKTVSVLSEYLLSLVEKGKISGSSFLLFVNDGSGDDTLQILKERSKAVENVCYISLSRNCGHQNALMAGLSTACPLSDMIVSIDADLQDDVNVIEQMVDEYADGAEIVYGVRGSRKSDTFFKRGTAQTYYRVLKSMGVKTIYNHADFRLMGKAAVEELLRYREKNLYIRGLIPELGFRTASVSYERKAREAGESKYPFNKMLSLALNGITSFSIKPLRLIISIGAAVMIICLAAAAYAFIAYLFGRVEKGWTSLILSIWFLGGVQLLSIGVIGEYIGKIYSEVKDRPLYCIEERELKTAGEKMPGE
jgi:glycosyltransferase involved in cell wall biosynthesis